MLIIFLIIFTALNLLLSILIERRLSRLKADNITKARKSTALKYIPLFFWALLIIFIFSTISIYHTITKGQEKIEKEISAYSTILNTYEKGSEEFIKNKFLINEYQKNLENVITLKHMLFLSTR